MGINAQQILGSDPEYLARQLGRQEIQQYQNFQNPQLGLAATSGALLGRGIANLFQGRGFFEVADPALRRVSDVNRIISEGLQGVDPTNPTAMANAYGNVAKSLAAAGYAQPAALAAAEASKMISAERAGRKVSTTYQGMNGDPLYEEGGRLFKMDGSPVAAGEAQLIVKDPLGNILGGNKGAGTKPADGKTENKKGKGNLRDILLGGQDKDAAPGTAAADAAKPGAGGTNVTQGTVDTFKQSEAAIEAEKKARRAAERKAMEPKEALPPDEKPKAKPAAKSAAKASKSKLPTDEEIEDGEWVIRDPEGFKIVERENQEILEGKRDTYSDKARSFFERP